MSQEERKTAPPDWPVFELKLIGVTGFVMHNFGAKRFFRQTGCCGRV